MIKGSIVDLVTPLLTDGAPDFESIEALVDWHRGEGSAALVVGSAAGQTSTLDFDDRRELLRRAIWQADGRIPVIAAVTIDLEDARDGIELASAAEDSGARALLLDLLAAGGAAQEQQLALIRKLAKATKLPLIVRTPASRSAPWPAAAIVELAKITGVTALVEGSADSNRVRELLGLDLPKDFALYSGHDASARQSILQGFHGAVSVTANLAPSQVREVYAAALAGDRAGSEGLEARLYPLHDALMSDVHAVAVIWALVEMGRINEGMRPPTLPASSDYSHLRRALRSAKILG